MAPCENIRCGACGCSPLWRIAWRSLSSHGSGIAGLVAFQYISFKHMLSRVEVSTESSKLLWCAVLAIASFTCVAVYASFWHILQDYVRRVAIEKAMSQGFGVRFPGPAQLHQTRLGRCTILLALLNMIILVADLVRSIWREETSRPDQLRIDWEVLSRTAPLMMYLRNLSSIATSPSYPWHQFQWLLQHPLPLHELLASAEMDGERNDCWHRISAALSRRGVRSSAGIELRNLNPEAEEASDVSSVMEAPVPTVSAAPWPLLCYLRPLVADRPYACHMHACLAVGMLVIFATVLPTWLWRIYEHSFIPQYLDLHVEGGTIKLADRAVDGVDYWLLPFDQPRLLLRLKPDVSTASRFYKCPKDICEPAIERSFQMHHSKMDPIEMVLTEEHFGHRSSFELRGFFRRKVYVGVVGFERIWMKLGMDLPQTLEMFGKNCFAKPLVRRDVLFPKDDHLTAELGFGANWDLMELVWTPELTVHRLDRNLKRESSTQLACEALGHDHLFTCRGLSFTTHCPASCDLVVRKLKVKPRKLVDRTSTERSFSLTAQIRDTEGFFLAPLLEKQKAVEVLRLTSGAHPSTEMLKAVAARNNLLAEAYRSFGAGTGSGSGEARRSTSLLLTGLTCVGKSSACYFLTNNETCEFSNSLESHTNSVFQVTGHAFEDRMQLILRVWDIPGFGDTKGEESFQEQWAQTMAHLAEHETGLDCILWVVNGAIRRKLAVRREMLRHYRSAFGASFYSYLKVLVNFVPMTDEASHQILMHEWIQQFRDFIIEEEKELLRDDWEQLEERVVTAVKEKLSILVVDLNPSYLTGPEKVEVPLSAPLVSRIPPYSQPVNLPDLLQLVEELGASSSGSRALYRAPLAIRPSCPRRGFAEVEAEATAVEIHGESHEFQIIVRIVGKYLGKGDGLLAQSADEPCGKGRLYFALNPAEDNHTNHTVLGGQPTWSFSQLRKVTLTEGVGPLKLCFCEAPGCGPAARSDEWPELPMARYCQDAGTFPLMGHLEVPALQPAVEPLAVHRCLRSCVAGETTLRCAVPCELGHWRVSCQEVSIHQNGSFYLAPSARDQERRCEIPCAGPGAEGSQKRHLIWSSGRISGSCDPERSEAVGDGIQEEGAKALALALPSSSLTRLDLSAHGLSDAGVKALAKALPKSQLTELDLTDNGIHLSGVSALAEALHEGAQLTKLLLSKNRLGEGEVQVLVGALGRSQLTWLGLSENDVTHVGAIVLGAALPETKLTVLDLTGNRICSETSGVHALAAALTKSQLKQLNLGSNSIGEAAEFLTSSLSESQLTELDLSDNGLGEAEVQDLAHVLPNCQLTSLNLQWNNVGDAGAIALAPKLGKSQLRELNLERTRIWRSGAIALAAGLSGSVLTSLWLSFNNLGDGIHSLARALPGSQLMVLSLAHSGMEVAGAQAIAKALPSSRLTELHLSSNELGDAGAEAVGLTLPQSQLLHLDLADNGLSHVGAHAIALALPKSQLTHLELSSNGIGDAGLRALADVLVQSQLKELDVSQNRC
ncbi:unnamed protein product [Durusdinium trenchii]|uniref:Uncharacterized protein n=1 Tax=Durusdinium trenchii TaxID=1381693 RepID=A0ABP0NMW7_9DINO